jgi:cytochrome c556
MVDAARPARHRRDHDHRRAAAAGADRDPATDTFASPDVWSNFADFYQRAQAASKIAFEASRAKRPDDFKALIVQLRAACNGCHATYMKPD